MNFSQGNTKVETGLKNFRHVGKYEEVPVEKQSQHTVPHGVVQSLQPEGQTANRSSYVSNEVAFHPSVSQGPPPSFLTQTPLGTPHEESAEFRPRAESLANRQQDEWAANPPSLEKKFEQAVPASVIFEKQMVQPRRTQRIRKGADKNGIVHRWVYEEVRLSMSKMSIMSLVLGLLFLKAHSSHGAWQASNAPAQGEQAQGGSGRLGNIAGVVAGHEINKQLQPLARAVGATSAIVPAPLQPFARYGIGSARAQVRSTVREINPFVHRGPHAHTQQHYPGAQQPPVMQPQYGQPYANQAAYPVQTGGYQQPGAMQQAGYGGVAYGQAAPTQQPMMMQQQPMQPQPIQQQPMQQQPMQPQMMQQPMQQPYYQQAMQQQPVPQQPMAPQQMMAPQQQMTPQQQMMQAPAYPQQMASQQNYYR
jgi:hypothetical protein